MFTNFIYLFSIFLYLLACYLPAFVGKMPERSISGLLALFFGAMAIEFSIFTIIAWWANFFYFIALILSFFSINSFFSIGLCLLAIFCSFGTFTIQYIQISPIAPPEEAKIGIAYYVWLGSFCTLLLYEVLKKLNH